MIFYREQKREGGGKRKENEIISTFSRGCLTTFSHHHRLPKECNARETRGKKREGKNKPLPLVLRWPSLPLQTGWWYMCFNIGWRGKGKERKGREARKCFRCTFPTSFKKNYFKEKGTREGEKRKQAFFAPSIV